MRWTEPPKIKSSEHTVYLLHNYITRYYTNFEQTASSSQPRPTVWLFMTQLAACGVLANDAKKRAIGTRDQRHCTAFIYFSTCKTRCKLCSHPNQPSHLPLHHWRNKMLPQSQACTKKCNDRSLHCRDGLIRHRDHNEVHPCCHHTQERWHPGQSKGIQRLFQFSAVRFRISLDGVWRKKRKSIVPDTRSKGRKLQPWETSVYSH